MTKFPESKALHEFNERAKRLNLPEPTPEFTPQNLHALMNAYNAHSNPYAQQSSRGNYFSSESYIGLLGALFK